MFGPFDLPGPAFLQLYGLLFFLAFVMGLVIPRWLRPDGHDGHLARADDLAYLAGGPERFVDAVTTRMLSTNAMVFDGKAKFALAAPNAMAGSAERSVLALGGTQRWSVVRRVLKREATTVQKRLVASGWMMDAGTAFQMRFWQTLPYLMLFVFGFIKLQVGLARDRPVGFLALFLVVTAVFALVRFASLDRRTRGGREALEGARRGSERLKRATTNDEADLAVALFGTAVLAGSSWAEFHRMRSANGSNDAGTSSSDSSSSDSGSSGCGGGGCGGCGS